MPPRRRNAEPQQVDIGPAQMVYLRPEPVDIFVADYLKNNYWAMAKQLHKKFECSICLEEIDCKVGCERCFTVLTCGHIYHLPCIIKVNPLMCPLCRNSNGDG